MRGNGSSKFIELLVFLLILLAASGCVETPDSGNESSPVNESATYWPTEGWRTSTPEQQGMDSEKLAELLDYVEENDINIHSLLIIRNGYVVTDVYFYPFTNNSVHDVASVTKSFTGTLIGIAISEGYIAGVDQPVLELFPNRTVANVDANKKAMTLEDLLTMIELELHTAMQLFNSFDPAPFHEKELDREAEEYIYNTVGEFPLKKPLGIFIYLPPSEADGETEHILKEAIRNHFSYKKLLTEIELKKLLQRGRRNMTIATLFLFLCLLVIRLLSTLEEGLVHTMLLK